MRKILAVLGMLALGGVILASPLLMSRLLARSGYIKPMRTPVSPPAPILASPTTGSLASSTTAPACEGIVTADDGTGKGGLNLRSAPRPGAPILAVLPKGSQVTILAEGAGEDGRWLYVRAGRVSGYVHGGYVTRGCHPE